MLEASWYGIGRILNILIKYANKLLTVSRYYSVISWRYY